MLGIAGQHPLLSDAPHRGFRPTHVSALRRVRAHLVFPDGIGPHGLGPTGGNPTLVAARKVMMVIVMVVVMRFADDLAIPARTG